MTKSKRQYLIDIGKIYGVKVTFNPDIDGGVFYGHKDTMALGEDSDVEMIRAFCHELAHALNKQNNKYSSYHRPETCKIKYFNSFIDYALRAEVYTEKVAKQICQIWFPNIKYKGYYKYNKSCKEFIRGYLINNWR